MLDLHTCKTEVADVTLHASLYKNSWRLACFFGLLGLLITLIYGFFFYVNNLVHPRTAALFGKDLDLLKKDLANQQPELWPLFALLSLLLLMKGNYSSFAAAFQFLLFISVSIFLMEIFLLKLTPLSELYSYASIYYYEELWEPISFALVNFLLLAAALLNLRLWLINWRLSTSATGWKRSSFLRGIHSLKHAIVRLTRYLAAITLFVILIVTIFVAFSLIEIALVASLQFLAGDQIFSTLGRDVTPQMRQYFSEGRHALFFAMIFIVALKIPLYLGAFALFIRAIRIAVQISRPGAQSVVALREKHIVLLRSFRDDQLKIIGRSLRSFIVGKKYRLEEVISDDISRIGWFVAIGQPKDHLAPLGAYKSYVADDKWKDVIASWLASSYAIIAVCGTTRSFAWELEQIRAFSLAEKTIFVFPPTSGDEFKSRWNFVRAAIPRLGDLDACLAVGQGQVRSVRIHQGGAIVVRSEGSTAFDYQIAVRLSAAGITPSPTPESFIQAKIVSD